MGEVRFRKNDIGSKQDPLREIVSANKKAFYECLLSQAWHINEMGGTWQSNIVPSTLKFCTNLRKGVLKTGWYSRYQHDVRLSYVYVNVQNANTTTDTYRVDQNTTTIQQDRHFRT